MSRIIIADPHGCYKTLKALIKQLPKGVPITIAGDLVDRGPQSRQIVKMVRGRGYDCIKGNHEDMMCNEITFKDNVMIVDYYRSGFISNGGIATLKSYDIEIHPESHCVGGKARVKLRKPQLRWLKGDIEWMKNLPLYIEYPELVNDEDQHLLVSHSTAGDIWQNRDSENQVQNLNFEFQIMWGRKSMPKKIPDIFNVYGHTPQKKGAHIGDYFANIDTGAYYQSIGVMTALQFPEMKLFTQKNIEEKTRLIL